MKQACFLSHPRWVLSMTPSESCQGGAGHASVLAYMIESKEPDGRVSPGFRPGYVAMVWPSDYASADWAYGHLSDGHPFSLVPRHSPVDSAASVVIDVLDAAQGTFSATPL